jgi:hypothetical protein
MEEGEGGHKGWSSTFLSVLSAQSAAEFLTLALKALTHVSSPRRDSYRMMKQALKARFNAPVRRQSHQIGAGMNRPAPAGLTRLALHESSPRRADYERRAFGANRFVQVKTWTNVPGFLTASITSLVARQARHAVFPNTP